MVNSVFILFFFKEIPKNGNKVKNKNHYSDESGEQKKESSTGKKTTHRFLRATSPGRRGRRLFGLQGGRECACRPYRPCLPRAGRSTGSASRQAPRHAPTRPELRSLPGHADPRVRAGAWRPAGLCTPYRVASGPRVSTHAHARRRHSSPALSEAETAHVGSRRHGGVLSAPLNSSIPHPHAHVHARTPPSPPCWARAHP